MSQSVWKENERYRRGLGFRGESDVKAAVIVQVVEVEDLVQSAT